MPTSQNGWPANDINLTKVWTIPGTQRKLRLEKGDAGFLLCHFAAWFDKNIEDIDPENQQLDDWGYAERPIRGSATTLSNHAAGTAIDLNALKHPLGAVNTFTPAQRLKIRLKLKEYEGCLRWGGDYVSRKDEMHFEINAPASKVAAVARKLRSPADDNTPTPSTPTKKKVIEVQNIVIPPGVSGMRLIIPVGSASAFVERAFLSVVVNGPDVGWVRCFAQSDVGGKHDWEWNVYFNTKEGRSQRLFKELQNGVTQVAIQYRLPQGGTICIETVGK